MESPPHPVTALLSELKRRKVVRAGLVYAAGAFAVLQVADIVVEPLGLPAGAMRIIVWACIVGFPLTLGVSWFFDVSRGEDGSRRWVSAPAGLAMGVLVAVGLGVWLLGPGADSAPDPDAGGGEAGELVPEVVAVLPFTVLGSDDAPYLSDAVAKLLGTSLDGVAGLRTVSSHALMGYPGLRNAQGITEATAGEVAAHFGAGLWLVGDVLQSGDSLRISATLAPVAGIPGPRVSAEVTAGVDDLFAPVDQLAALLLAEREADSGSDRTRSAALTTGSMAALRAWIEGERAFRAGSYLPAVDAFTRAVEADTTFALAFHRLSMTEERLAWAEASRASAETAYRHSDRLSRRDRDFLEAVVALRRGNTSRAEQMLRSYVRVHPDDPEGWYQLGEILFHGEPLRGGSMTAAREPLERALFYDPGDLGALYHLVRIAIKEGDRTRLDSLTARFVALSPTGERTLELRALQAASLGETAAFQEILGEMRNSPDPFLPIAVWSVAVFGRDPAGAEAIAGLMTGPDRPAEVRGAGHVQRAFLAMAQGRRGDALEELERASALGDPDADEARAWLAALPFGSGTTEEREAARRAMRSRLASVMPESPRPSSFFSAQNGVHPLVTLYLEGLLAADSAGEEAGATRAAALESMAETDGQRTLARQLATGLRAREVLEAGDSARALEILSGLVIEGWYELTFVSPWWSGALERFTRAELLLAAGRGDEALGWYQGLGENTVAELSFLGPALLRESAIHQAAGREQPARDARARFEELWAGADPVLRDEVLATFGGAAPVTVPAGE